MEPFHLLSGGGAKFDKKRFESDVRLFNVRDLLFDLKKTAFTVPLVAL
jgi:hypothetical protein